MKTARTYAVLGAVVLVLVVVTAGVFRGLRLAAIGTAYTAKTVCSGIFVSQRDLQSLLDVDLSADDLAILRHVRVEVDRELRRVTARFLGLAARTAVYREGRGCAVIHGDAARAAVPRHDDSHDQIAGSGRAVDALAVADSLTSEEARRRLDKALEWAFSEPDPALPRRTRAVVVVHGGRLVAERYARGFTEETPLLGWSMTKSVINALVGVLVEEGRVSLDDPAPIPAWHQPSDPRRRITFDHLLRMTSGLRFDEDQSDPFSDVISMLLGVPDAAAYAAAKPLDAEPGTRWSYSSGTTNILAYAIRRIVGDSGYWAFPRRALFDRLSMSSAVLETDASGTFVGSSFMYATARDWARLGLLYLDDGVWSGTRILPEGWVAHTQSPTPSSPDGRYGAHVWLRVPGEYRCGGESGSPPADAFHAIGHEGQFLTIVPSLALVLVRLGLTRYPCAWDHHGFIELVSAAIAREEPSDPARQRTR